MIMVIAGTSDGRSLVQRLAREGYPLIVSVTTEYGKNLMEQEGILINDIPLDETGFIHFLHCHAITCIVDASHPYAVNVSRNAGYAAGKMGNPYIRYERPPALLPEYDKLYVVHAYEEAADKAMKLGKNIFLTTGSHQLQVFRNKMIGNEYRLIARVLPQVQSIEDCLAAGFAPRDIIALQGPFSHEFNRAMFEAYAADVVIMKNSGHIGGTDTKITAGMAMNLSLVVIDRPPCHYGRVVESFADVMNCLKEVKQWILLKTQ